MIRYFYAADTGMELVKCEDSYLSYPLHNHVSVFIIGMILSGTIQLIINGQKSIIAQNQIFIIPPYVPHSINAKSKYTMLTLCIHKERIKRINKKNLISASLFLIDKAFEYKEIKQDQILLFSDSISLCKSQTHMPAVKVDYVQNLMQMIEHYPEYSLTIDEMSRQVYVSKYHFIRGFKREVGLTPHQFQIQNKVRKAQLLLNQPISITEVALTAGFFDQSHLIKCFKKIVGLTPSCYKSSCQQFQTSIQSGHEFGEKV